MPFRSIHPGVALLGFLLALTPAARACVDYADYSQIVSRLSIGAAQMPALAVDGTNACICAEGQGLAVVDITDPEMPRFRSWVDTAGYAYDVAMQGGFAYVAEGIVGLQVVEVSRFIAPHIVSTLGPAGSYTAVAVSGGRAYLVDSYGMLDVVDVSVPANPRRIHTFYLSARGVAALGGYAYLLGRDSVLYVIDATQDHPPSIVGSTQLAPESYSLAAGPGMVCVTSPSGFQVVDVSDPSAPHRVGFTNAVEGGTVIVDGAHARAYVTELLASAIDISDPSNPRPDGGVFGARPIGSIFVQGEHAYLLDGSEDLLVARISEPPSADLVGYLETPSMGGLSVDGTRAYLATSYRGLEIVDITEPGFPVLLGSINDWVEAMDVVSRGSYAYVATTDGLVIVDASNPGAPVITGRLESAAVPFSIALQGDLAFIGTWYDGLEIINVSDPTSPFVEGEVTTPSMVFDVAVSGSLAYVADGEGFRVIDITNPAHPVIVGSIAQPFCYTVSVFGNLACVIAGGYPSDDLISIDVSQASAPRIIGHLPVLLGAGIALDGNLAYLAVAGGLLVVDTSDPGSMREVGERATPESRMTEVAEQDGYVYLAGWYEFAVCAEQCASGAAVDGSSRDPRGLAIEVATPIRVGDPVAIRVTLPHPGDLRLDVFDVGGRKVGAFLRRGLAAGPHVITWDGRRTPDGAIAPRGVYLVRAICGRNHEVARIVRY